MLRIFVNPFTSLGFMKEYYSERSTCPGFLYSPLIRAYFSQSAWVGDSDGQIDEIKEINAIEKQIKLGLITHERASAQLKRHKLFG